ncbi:3-phosphoshikimate 1-carboxyvinyltransferase [Candidatus Omnitrophota bacterium]
MTDFCCMPEKKVQGEICVPGDKSISHRFVIFSSIAEGKSCARNMLTGEDCLTTISAFRTMGVTINLSGTSCEIVGVGKYGLKQPEAPLFLGNSGTTMRLLTGLLAGQKFNVILEGDSSLSKRPMDRVVLPLREMKAQITGEGDAICPPLSITGQSLQPIVHNERLGSAQVKSSILLAGLYSKGATTVIEERRSRDHTEKMLEWYGAQFEKKGNSLTIHGSSTLNAVGEDIIIPGDISSAAFFIVAALIIPGSALVIKNVCLNPTRIGILTILKEMGANIEIKNHKKNGEPCGDIVVKYSQLKGVTVKHENLSFLIDEIPILMVACALAEGKSCIEDASELRVKETDRIESMTKGLIGLGADISVDGDTIYINGKKSLKGDVAVMSCDDHRTAMSLIVAGLASEKPVTVKDIDCMSISYPNFINDLAYCLGEAK